MSDERNIAVLPLALGASLDNTVARRFCRLRRPIVFDLTSGGFQSIFNMSTPSGIPNAFPTALPEDPHRQWKIDHAGKIDKSTAKVSVV